MSLLKLQQDIIYGPVYSRRLGRSLGVNLLPTKIKICPFNCVYCDYGQTDLHTARLSEKLPDIPSPIQVRNVLEATLRDRPELDYITFSGNGEPTLHPEIGEIVDVVREVRDAYAPAVKLAILSNSCVLGQDNVREAVSKLDTPIMKLDVGSQELLQKVNRPSEGITLSDILAGLRRVDGITIQTMLFGGVIDNSREESVMNLAKALRTMRPVFVQVYTTDRPTSEAGLIKLRRKELERIAQQIEEVAGTKAEAYSLQCPLCGSEALNYVSLPSGEHFYQCRCGYKRRLL